MAQTQTITASRAGSSEIVYDMVGMIAKSTSLTRKTVVAILKGIAPHIYSLYKLNPEEFISKVSVLINAQKATMIVDDITYSKTKGSLDSMELRKIEDAKISCAKKLFNDLSTSMVRYHEVTNYSEMLDIINNIS